MLAFTRLQLIVDRFIRSNAGGTSTEFVYVLVALVVVTAFGAAILGDDVRAFFKGFEFRQSGISFG